MAQYVTEQKTLISSKPRQHVGFVAASALVLLTAAATATLPPGQAVFSNPARRPVHQPGFAYRSATVDGAALPPVAQMVDRPPARRPVAATGFAFRSPALDVVSAVPFAQTNWPNPTRPRVAIANLTWAQGRVIAAPAAMPFAQTNWPNPPRARIGPALLRVSQWRFPHILTGTETPFGVDDAVVGSTVGEVGLSSNADVTTAGFSTTPADAGMSGGAIFTFGFDDLV